MRARLLLLFLPFVLFFVSCSRQDPDAKLQAKLAGNWVLESTPFSSNNNFQSRLTIDSLGHYVVNASATTASNALRTFDIEGNYRVKDGWLIDTMINNSQLTNKASLPSFNTNKIVRLTGNQLILNIETAYKTGEVVFRKEGK